MSRKVLGRGLSDLFIDKVSLIQSDSSATSNIVGHNSVAEIDLNLIKPCSTQPRQIFDENALNELADSIRANGVLQPIIVRKINGSENYEIIAGERRWRASNIAQKQTIPVVIKNLDDHKAFLISIIENLQRSDLSPLEEAEVYQRLANDGYTHDQIAAMLNKSRSYISNSTRLINLTPKVKEFVRQKVLSVGHAKLLLTNGISEKDQDMIAEQIVEQSLNIKQTDELIKKVLGEFDSDDEGNSDNEGGDRIKTITNKEGNKIPKTQKSEYDLQEIAELLKEGLDSDVVITNKQIMISYKNIVDLDRLLGLLIK